MVQPNRPKITHGVEGRLTLEFGKRFVFSHVHAGMKEKPKPKPRKPVVIPLFFNKHAKGMQKVLLDWRENIIGSIKVKKAGKTKSAIDKKEIAHLGNQEKILIAMRKIAKREIGNVSEQKLERLGVDSDTIKKIAAGDLRLEVQFDSNHRVNLERGYLLVLDPVKRTVKQKLSPEQLARILLSFNQISTAQIIRRTT